MAGDMFVRLVMIVRSIVRLAGAEPAPATTGSPRLDRLAGPTHFNLCRIGFLMIATGRTTGFLIRGAFGPGGRPPATFAVPPTFQAQAALATLLALLMALAPQRARREQ